MTAYYSKGLCMQGRTTSHCSSGDLCFTRATDWLTGRDIAREQLSILGNSYPYGLQELEQLGALQ